MKLSSTICLLSACGIVTVSLLPTVAKALPRNILTADPAALTIAQASGDVIDVAASSGSFTTLLTLLQTLGMEEDLRGYGRFTVFAPTNAAFAALDPDVITFLLADENREILSRVLAYHVIASGLPLYADDITSTTSLSTLERSDVELTPDGSSISVNGVKVIEADIEANNGVIHVIDQVLIPPSIATQLP